MQDKKFLIALKPNNFQYKIWIKFQQNSKLELEVAENPTKATKTKTKYKTSSLKLREEFLNEIKSEEKNIN